MFDLNKVSSCQKKKKTSKKASFKSPKITANDRDIQRTGSNDTYI